MNWRRFPIAGALPGKKSDRTAHYLTGLLLLAYAAIGVAVFLDFGVSWDEYYAYRHGEAVWNWYASGFSDRTAIEATDFRFYGGLSHLVAYLFTRILPFPLFQAAHVSYFLFSIVGLYFAARIGNLLGGSSWGGFWAVLFLALYPAYFGHAFINPKDLPAAALYLAATYFAARLVAEKQLSPETSLPLGQLLKAGIWCGLLFGVRNAGILVLGVLAIVLALLNFKAVGLKRGMKTWGREILPVLGCSWLIMLAFWPFAQVNPVLNPLLALRESFRFHYEVDILYGGEIIRSDALPLGYVPRWVLMGLPEFAWYALVAILVLLYTRREQLDWKKHWPKILAVALALSPLALAMLTQARLYNQLRHLLFATSLLVVVAGSAWAWVIVTLCSCRAKVLLLVGMLALMLLTVVDMVQVHPYEYAYMNRLPSGSKVYNYRNFDTDYWGLSLKAGFDWIVANRQRFNLDRPLEVCDLNLLGPGWSFSPLRYYYLLNQ